MFARTQRLFQLSLITVFATLFFLGTMGINIAQAIEAPTFEGSGKINFKKTCSTNGLEIVDKSTRKGIADLVLYISDRYIDASFTEPGFGTIDLFGMRIPKNKNTSNFQIHGSLVGGPFDLYMFMTGKIISKNGVVKKVIYKAFITDRMGGCVLTAISKATPIPVLPPG